MGQVLPKDSRKAFHDFRSEAATINLDYKMGGFQTITVSAKTTGTGRWEVLGTNDEDGSGNPQNFLSLVASAVTLISKIDPYRWVRLAYTKGDSSTGEVGVMAVRD